MLPIPGLLLIRKFRDGGLWNGRKVAEWMSQITGKTVTRMRGWEDLKQMEYSLRVPRPEHQEISIVPLIPASILSLGHLKVQQTDSPDQIDSPNFLIELIVQWFLFLLQSYPCPKFLPEK